MGVEFVLVISFPFDLFHFFFRVCERAQQKAKSCVVAKGIVCDMVDSILSLSIPPPSFLLSSAKSKTKNTANFFLFIFEQQAKK